MRDKDTISYIIVTIGAIILGIIAGLILNIQIFSEDNNKIIIYLDKNPGIIGNWSYESDSDFRYILFKEDNSFTFEQWITVPYTTHIQYTGRWDKISEDIYRLYPDIIRPDIPALMYPYVHKKDINGIYIYDTLEDKMNRTYLRSDLCNLPGTQQNIPWRDILKAKEEKERVSYEEYLKEK